MRISQAFPSKYVSAGDLNGREMTLTIARVDMETLDQQTNEAKPVVYFQGAQKGMVLNKTNANNIAAVYGDETDGWIGGQITLFTQYVDFQGRSVEAIRVRPVQAASPQVQAAHAQPATALDADPLAGDDVPF